MRIALAGSKGVPGRHGVEVVVEELGARLAALGHDVTIFSWAGYSDSAFHRGCRVECTPGPVSGALAMPLHAVRSFRTILRRRRDFDLVHIHSVDPFLFAGRLTDELPVVVTSHGRAYLAREAGLARRALSRLAEKRFLSSNCRATAVAAHLAAYYDEVAPGRVFLVRNATRSLGTGGGRVLTDNCLEPGSYAVFAAGRLVPSKGLHTLLEAWLMAGIPLRLAVAGPIPSGRYGSRMAAMLKEAGAAATGLLEAPDLGDLMRGARFGAVPSQLEAQSMSLLDMLSCGLTVVYSDIPGNRELARGLGFSFEPGSRESLVRALCEAAGDRRPGDQPAMRRVLELHDPDRVTEAYLDVYRQALSAWPGR